MKIVKVEIHGIEANVLMDKLDSIQVQLKALQKNKVEPIKLLSRHEVAKMLGISLMTLYTWTKKGIIPAYRIGNKIKYKKSEVLESMELVNPKTSING